MDTSHGEQADGKSHIGGAMGFECDTSCYFALVSSKQAMVVIFFGEAEMIAESKIRDYNNKRARE